MTQLRMIKIPKCKCKNPECVRDETAVFAGAMLLKLAELMMKSKRQYHQYNSTATHYLSLVNAFAVSMQVYPDMHELLEKFVEDVTMVSNMIAADNEEAPAQEAKKPDFVAHGGVPFYWNKEKK